MIIYTYFAKCKYLLSDSCEAEFLYLIQNENAIYFSVFYIHSCTALQAGRSRVRFPDEECGNFFRSVCNYIQGGSNMTGTICV
jgi:hypothetical protein